MTFESFDHKPNRLDSSYGQKYEALFAKPIQCDWDAEKYIETRKKDSTESHKMVEDWIDHHVMTLLNGKVSPQVQDRKEFLSGFKKHQPEDWNPTDPPLIETEFAGEHIKSTLPTDLHAACAEALGLEDYSELKLFTAANTPADTLYGVDLILEYGGSRLLIDVATNVSNKEWKLNSSDKADYILRMGYDEEGRRRKLQKKEIETEGQKMATYLLKRIEEDRIMKEEGISRAGLILHKN